MALQAVEEQAPVGEREALAPAVAGLAATLRSLPADDPDYRGLRKLHRLLAGKQVIEEATGSADTPALFADAVEPALSGLRETHGMLDEDHWARLAISSLHRHLRWQTRKPEPLPRAARDELGD